MGNIGQVRRRVGARKERTQSLVFEIPDKKGRDKMPEAPANANWFTYFPQDYRWSAAICGMISGARWGASEIGEVDKVGRRLKQKLGGA